MHLHRKAGNQEPNSLLFSHDVCPSRIPGFNRLNQPYEPCIPTPTEPYVSLVSPFLNLLPRLGGTSGIATAAPCLHASKSALCLSRAHLVRLVSVLRGLVHALTERRVAHPDCSPLNVLLRSVVSSPQTLTFLRSAPSSRTTPYSFECVTSEDASSPIVGPYLFTFTPSCALE